MPRLPRAASACNDRLPLRSVILDEFNRRSHLRRRSMPALIIWITLATFGLFGTASARGQFSLQPQYQGTVTGFWYGPGGSMAVGTFNSTETPPCGDRPPTEYGSNGLQTTEYREWQECIDERNAQRAFGEMLLGGDAEPIVGSVFQPAPQAGPTFTPTLDSSAAALPFLGNQLVGISFVPNATTAATATAAYSVTLRRQPDCSINEDLILPDAQAQPNSNFFTSLTGAQDFYHQLAGLTTKPDVFANGCGFQDLGLPATNTISLLGTTPSGAIISAELANAGLYVTLTDLTANTFKSTPVTSSPTQSAGYYSSASLRNNGIMDLVETDITDPVTKVQSTAVILSNGDGTFKTPVYYDVADNGAGPGGFTIDDVNGDGKPDIVVLQTATTSNTIGYPTFTGTVTTLIGKGDGTFTVGPVSNVSWTSSNLTLTGDFNGDGNRDLLVGGTVLFGKGDGTFTVGPTNTAIAVANTTAVFGNAAGNLRNNGKLDVVVSVPGFVSIFYGNGDGTFQTGPSYAGLPDFMNVTITDIDGDGNPDIFLGNSTAGVYAQGVYDIYPPMFQILMGRGDGTFVDAVAYPVGTYTRDKQIASADFNGDSKADVLVFNSSKNGSVASSLAMLPGDGKGGLGAAIASTVNNQPVFLAAARMFHDTLPDAVVAGYGANNSGPEVSILTNQGNGTFAAEKDYSLAANPVSLAVGDFNGDGLPDVAVGETGMGVFVLFGQSNGTLGTPVQVDTSTNPTGLAAGSLTTDGRADLIVADQATGTLHVYLGNANNTFTSKTAPTTGATNLNVAALGDLNNDGKLDLIVTGFIPGNSSAGTFNVANLYTLLGNGDGTFQAAKTLALVGTDGQPTSIALADFNKDGKLDVVIGNSSDYTEVLIGNGDGTFIDTMPALGQRPASVAAADLNGDGYSELLVGQPNTDGQGATLAVFLNQATWTAASTTTTPTVTVTPSSSSITTAQSLSVTVGVSGGSGTATGSVALSGGGYTSAATALASGSAIITVPAGALATGTDTLTATYTPDSASSSVYTSATGSNTVTVTPALVPSFALSNSGNISFAAASTSGNTATVTVTPSNGFTGTVNLSCVVTTIPAGAISPATCGVTNSVSITGTTAQSATLTVTTTTTTTAGAYAITVTGVSGSITQSTVVSVTVTTYVPPSFGLGNGGNLSFAAGASTGNTSTITVTPSGGFTGTVNLSCAMTTIPTGAPNPATCGVTSSVNVASASAVAATLTVNTTSTTTIGAYAVTVTGTSGSITQTTVVGVTVTVYIPPPNFALSNSGAITVTKGATTGNTSTITVAPSGGFTGSVALTAALTASPAGASNLPTFSFGATTPVSITGSGNGTGMLTVTTTAATSAGLVQPKFPWYAAGGATLAGVLLLGIPANLRRWRALLGMFILLALLTSGIVSCGAKSTNSLGSGNPGTTAGSYTITVTGTSGALSQTTTVSLTVN